MPHILPCEGVPMKTAVRYHTPVTMVQIQTLTSPNADEDVEQQERTHRCGKRLQNGTATLEVSWWLLKK